MTTLQQQIETAWETRENFDKNNNETRAAIEGAVALLDRGEARVAEPTASGWQVNEWLKKAELLYFRLHDNAPIEMGGLLGYDKVPLKFAKWSDRELNEQGERVVPTAD